MYLRHSQSCTRLHCAVHYPRFNVAQPCLQAPTMMMMTMIHERWNEEALRNVCVRHSQKLLASAIFSALSTFHYKHHDDDDTTNERMTSKIIIITICIKKGANNFEILPSMLSVSYERGGGLSNELSKAHISPDVSACMCLVCCS